MTCPLAPACQAPRCTARHAWVYGDASVPNVQAFQKDVVAEMRASGDRIGNRSVAAVIRRAMDGCEAECMFG